MKKILILIVMATLLFTSLGSVASAEAEVAIFPYLTAGGEVQIRTDIVYPGGGDGYVPISGNVTCVATPYEGYSLYKVFVGKLEIPFNDNKFELSGITEDTKLFVIFKSNSASSGVSADDVDWNYENITVEAKSGKPICREIFEIAYILEKTVEIKTDGATFIYTPTIWTTDLWDNEIFGFYTIGESDIYDSIRTAIQLRCGSETDFVAYRDFSGSIDGMRVSMQLDFGDRLFSYRSDYGIIGEITDIQVEADGTTSFSRTYYDDILIVVRNRIPIYNITVISGKGGASDCGEKVSVQEGASIKITFRADEGYFIKAIEVNGSSISVNEASTEEYYEITNASEAYIIEAKFEKFAPVVDDTSVEESKPEAEEDDDDDDKKSSKKKDNLLMIILIAGGGGLLLIAITVVVIIIVVKKKKKKNRPENPDNPPEPPINPDNGGFIPPIAPIPEPEDADEAEPELGEAEVPEITVPPVAPISDDFKFCTACGAKISADSAFCTACGAKQ